MPSSPGYVRDYKREAAIRHTPKDLAENASRKRARRMLEKEGVVSKGDGKDVDHKNRNPMSNGRGNLTAKPKAANRSYSRKTNAKKYGNNVGASNPPTQTKYKGSKK
tara:strand:+ start:2963 stop:3283 length:321 start_codon:yes stop_codon:yes gene_type:complete